ncbi:MAG: hypothetical protein IH623_09815 [Verrucomicrobia bacterium]|nr:hypothetical protein [Verrucomicrobiota bacterium]
MSNTTSRNGTGLAKPQGWWEITSGSVRSGDPSRHRHALGYHTGVWMRQHPSRF